MMIECKPLLVLALILAAVTGHGDDATHEHAGIVMTEPEAAKSPPWQQCAKLVVPVVVVVVFAMLLWLTRHSARVVFGDTIAYWACLRYYWSGGNYEDCPHFADSLHARVHVSSIAFIMDLWSMPHYRNPTFRHDLVKNLRNVAIPGTGMPLSWLCYHRPVMYAFLIFGYPLVALIVALRTAHRETKTVAEKFQEVLLEPRDWFSLWRLNCNITSLHAWKTDAPGYAMENKWDFLKAGMAKGVAVSPVLDIANLVVKDKNEEGGLGIHFYQNALNGGQWIIQKALTNAPVLARLLPPNAPLSTIRVVTKSLHAFSPDEKLAKDPAEVVEALSCVFRAGRAGASTDHKSILFDVDSKTGRIRLGTTNQHWYQLGVMRELRKYWTHDEDAAVMNQDPSVGPITTAVHPDCGSTVAGEVIEHIAELKELCIVAHHKLCPDVPLCGWDVALTTDGVCLLETNLMCNFFQADFDFGRYLEYVDAGFKFCDDARLAFRRGEKTQPGPAFDVEAPIEKAAPELVDAVEPVDTDDVTPPVTAEATAPLVA